MFYVYSCKIFVLIIYSEHAKYKQLNRLFPYNHHAKKSPRYQEMIQYENWCPLH